MSIKNYSTLQLGKPSTKLCRHSSRYSQLTLQRLESSIQERLNFSEKSQIAKVLSRVWTSFLQIGQITLLRREMAFSKRISCRRTCETLFLSLKAYNKWDIYRFNKCISERGPIQFRQLVSNPSELPEDAPSLAELFKQCGLFSPELQILDAQTSIASVKITLPLFSLLITNLSRFEGTANFPTELELKAVYKKQWRSPSLGTRKDSVCEVSFLVGALFCLKQTNEVADFSIALEMHQSSQAMLPKKYQIDMQKTLQKVDIIFSWISLLFWKTEYVNSW